MSRNYKFHNPNGSYFVSFSVVNWLNVLAENHYKDIIIDSLDFCIKKKGLELFAYCIMTNHVHLIFRSLEIPPEILLGHIKSFTSREIIKTISTQSENSQDNFFLKTFKRAAKTTSNVKNYQFWQHDNMPKELWSNKVTYQKLNYVHQNPVKAGFVQQPEDYKYSSALDYAGKKGCLDGVVVIM